MSFVVFRVYVEVVLNHMTRDVGSVNGSAYSHADTSVLRYPAVPYKKSDFHEACDIKDENDIDQVNNGKGGKEISNVPV